MKKHFRQFAAVFAAFAVLMSQLAVAAHPCAQLTATMLSMHQAAEADDDCGCPTEDASPSALCKKHCENGNQNLATAFTPDLSFTPTFALRITEVDLFASHVGEANVDHAADPPFAHRKAILRI